MKVKKKSVKIKDSKKIDIQEVLIKKAVGYTTEEITEEFSKVDDDLVLNKRKVSTKSYPPDLSALQILMENYKFEDNNEFDSMSLEELENEKLKLLKQLESIEKGVQNDS